MQVSSLYRLKESHLRRLLRGDEILLDHGIRIRMDKNLTAEDLRHIFYPLIANGE